MDSRDRGATGECRDARRAAGPTVAVLGGGAAGALVAAQVARQAARAGRTARVVVVEPGELGVGVAYSTTDRRHRLNVAASGMSALPDEPDHFLRWLRAHGSPEAEAYTFAARADYGRYLADVLQVAVSAAPGVRLEHARSRAVAVRPHGRRWRVTLADGTARAADAVVLALGPGRPSVDWAPADLRRSERFVADPWATPISARPGTRVVLVGAGLTMVDQAMSRLRPEGTVHAVSRSGMLPLTHPDVAVPRIVPADLPARPTFADLRRLVFGHVRSVVAAGGDWRSAVDGLRVDTSTLWRRTPTAERERFLRLANRRWSRVRHRVAPVVGSWLDAQVAGGALVSHRGSVVTSTDTSTGIEVELDDGTRLRADHVVNCTGPVNDVTRSDDPLLMNLLDAGLVQPGPHGLGLACTDDGRVIALRSRPTIWAVGALRQGELWESTAMPEIRTQAADLAGVLLAALPLPSIRRRPRDPFGLPLTTTPEAARAYNEGLGRILRVQSGAQPLLEQAVALDPRFALAHATLALLGREWDAAVDVRAALRSARRELDRLDERERRFVQTVVARVDGTDSLAGKDSAAALIQHIGAYPEDALAVSVAVPTIAFGGATDVPAEAWALVEGLAPAYGDHWWYASMLAFIRQEQGRFDEASALADRALAVEPGSGHAVHARTHVHYETGDHRAGLAWLDGWIATCGRAAEHRAHFSWHAALHELALGRNAAATRRYATQLAPPGVSGVRALVDSASLLWRGQLLAVEGLSSREAVAAVVASVPESLLTEPECAFTALHAAIALAAAGDCRRLAALRRHAEGRPEPAFARTVAPLADALSDLVHDDAARAFRGLWSLRGVERLGGSDAQREVVEDTLLVAAMRAGEHDAARTVLDRRLDRRPSAQDAAWRASLRAPAGSGGSRAR